MSDREEKSGPADPAADPAAVIAMVNRTMCFLAALTVMGVGFYASFFPRPLVLPTMSVLLNVCAFAAASVAVLRWQPPVVGYFTFWDVAAVLFFLALAAGMLSDPDAVKAYLQTLDRPLTTPSPN